MIKQVSGNGKCTYLVGSQNWLRIISTQSTIIDESGEYEVVVKGPKTSTEVNRSQCPSIRRYKQMVSS